MLRVVVALVVLLLSSVCVLSFDQRRHSNILSLESSTESSTESSADSSIESSSSYPEECEKEVSEYCSSSISTADDLYTCFNNNYDNLTVKCANAVNIFYSYNTNHNTAATTSSNSNSIVYFLQSIFDGFYLFQPSYYFISFVNDDDYGSGTTGDDDYGSSSMGDVGDDYESLSSILSSPCNVMKEYDIDNDDDDDYDDDDYFEGTDGSSGNNYDDIFNINTNSNVIDDGMDDQSQEVVESSRVNEKSYYFSTPFPFILYSFLTTGYNTNTISSNDATSSISSTITSSDIASDATSIAADAATIDLTKDSEVHSKGYLLDQ